MLATGCTGLDALNPVCQVGSLGGSLASSGFQAALDDISQWVASGAEWLLAQIGDVLVSTTTVDIGATWFRTHYADMTALAGVVILPLLLLSVLQAVLRQNPGQLVRVVLVQMPLALVLGGVAIEVVILSLSATDAMSDAIAGGSGADVTSLLTGVTSGLVAAAADPSLASFVLLLVALLVAVAAFVLWLELLIRAAAVYVAVLFLPLALATLVWPAVSHWCRRLVETLAALILSKFVIVAVLSLAAGAVASGTAGGGAHGSGFSSVLAGGALLVMATFVPFSLLRLIPVMEAGAVGHLDGLRGRATGAMTRPARTAAQHALSEGLQGLGAARLLAGADDIGGGAAAGAAGAAGGATASGAAGATGAAEAGDDGTEESAVPAVPLSPNGDPEPDRILAEYASGQRTATLAPKGPKPIVGWRPEGDGDGEGGGGEGGGGGEVGGSGGDPDMGGLPGSWVTNKWGGREWRGAQGPDDAWKWKDVPAGYDLVGPIEPGQTRHCFGADETGLPRLKYLQPAWPPGQQPAEGGTG